MELANRGVDEIWTEQDDRKRKWKQRIQCRVQWSNYPEQSHNMGVEPCGSVPSAGTRGNYASQIIAEE